MESLRGQLRGARWGLARARSLAEEIVGDKVGVRMLVGELFGEDAEVRKRAWCGVGGVLGWWREAEGDGGDEVSAELLRRRERHLGRIKERPGAKAPFVWPRIQGPEGPCSLRVRALREC
jgi:hypothetical protein